MESLKKRYAFLGIFAIVLLAMLICLLTDNSKKEGVSEEEAPEYCLVDGKIERDISSRLRELEIEPQDRNVAWDSELPAFVVQDMAYAEENNYEIQYKVGVAKIVLYQSDGEWNVHISYPYSSYLVYDTLWNFSMYQTEKGNLVLYGYDDTFYDYFIRIVLLEDRIDYDILTYDSNIPFFEDKYQTIGVRLGEYSLTEINDKRTSVFSFYKDGEEICSYNFTHGQCDFVSLYDGVIVNNKKEMYMMYVELKNNMPLLSFIYVGVIDSIDTTYKRELLENKDEQLPLLLVIKDEQYYVAVPDDWNAYEQYSVTAICNRSGKTEIQPSSYKFNYGLKLVEFTERFDKAKFVYEESNWYAEIWFTINGKEFEVHYYFNGYDSSVKLPEEVVKELETTVTSIDELWNTIHNIRMEYFNYYEQRGDFPPYFFYKH